MRGKARSSANLVAPVTFAVASTFRRARPMTRRFLSAIQGFPRCFSLFAAHSRGGQFDCLVDLDVAGTTAEVAGQRIFDFVARGCGIRGEQGLSGEQKRGCTVAALRGAKVRECLLQRMELAARGHGFDRADVPSGARETEHE